jgi:hypothetical protein
MGRKSVYGRPMTGAERQARHRENRVGEAVAQIELAEQLVQAVFNALHQQAPSTAGLLMEVRGHLTAAKMQILPPGT